MTRTSKDTSQNTWQDRDTEGEAVTQFVEDMGLVAEGEGLSRIAGRIMALLIVEEHPVSFADLAGRLQISRASVSTNTRLLQSLGVIERTTRPGERQDYFQIAPNPYLRFLQGASERLEKAKSVVRRAQETIGPKRTQAGAHLDRMYGYFDALSCMYGKLVSQYSEKS